MVKFCREKRRYISSELDNWSELPEDLLVDIAKRMKSVENLVAIRGVCTNWRFFVREKPGECQKFHSLSNSMVPFLMFEEDNDDHRKFLNLSKEKVYVSLSEVKNKRCIESRFGWFLCTYVNDGDVELFNTFSGARILVPKPYSDEEKLLPVTKFVLSADPSVRPHDFMVVAVINYDQLAFWRPEKKKWTWPSLGNSIYLDVIFSESDRRIYAVYIGLYRICGISSWDGDDGNLSWVVVANDVKASEFVDSVYLVESSDGELLLVTRGGATIFKVYRVNSSNGVVEERTTSLKDAIFISESACFALVPNGVVQSNHIYFTNDLRCGKDMGIYNLEDGSIQRFPLILEASPQLWLAPSSTFPWLR